MLEVAGGKSSHSITREELLRRAEALRLFNAAGGRALYLDNVLQRQFRDCYAAASHHSLMWDTAAMDYGRYALGLEDA